MSKKVLVFTHCGECHRQILVGDEVHEMNSEFFCSMDCVDEYVFSHMVESYVAKKDDDCTWEDLVEEDRDAEKDTEV